MMVDAATGGGGGGTSEHGMPVDAPSASASGAALLRAEVGGATRE